MRDAFAAADTGRHRPARARVRELGPVPRLRRARATGSPRRRGPCERRRAPVADRTIARRRPKQAAANPTCGSCARRSFRAPQGLAVATARRNLTLLLVPTALLTVVGLVMILSAGSISAVEGYGTSFWYFNRQALYALAGVIGLVVTARRPVHLLAAGGDPDAARSAPGDAPRAPPGDRLVPLRRVAVDRPRPDHAPTRGVREVPDRLLRGGDPVSAVEGPRSRPGRVPSARAARARRRGARAPPTGPRHDADHLRQRLPASCSSRGFPSGT